MHSYIFHMYTHKHGHMYALMIQKRVIRLVNKPIIVHHFLKLKVIELKTIQIMYRAKIQATLSIQILFQMWETSNMISEVFLCSTGGLDKYGM